MELEDFVVESKSLYTCENGDQRYVHVIHNDMINYSVPGVMTMLPLFCSVEEFYQWGKENSLQ
jgi:hypothetical protein